MTSHLRSLMLPIANALMTVLSVYHHGGEGELEWW